MNKEFFINYVNTLINFEDLISKYDNIINIDNPIYDNFDKLSELIKSNLLSQEQRDWLDWWLYDYRQGCTVKDENNEIINLDTVEKLWDFIK